MMMLRSVMIILRMVSLISMMTMLILMIMMIDILMMMLIKGIISGTFRRSKTDPTLLRTEPVEAKAVDRIQKSETCDPEIQRSRNIEAKNPKSGSDMIQLPEKIVKLIIDKYRSSSTALPPTVRRTLSSTALPKSKKYLPKPKTLYPVRTKIPVNCKKNSRIVNSGL